MPTLPKSANNLLILTLLTLTLIPNPTSSLYLNRLHQSPYFEYDAELSGDADLIHHAVHLRHPLISSSHGSIIKNKPFKFNHSNPISFSTDFSFSISPHNVEGRELSFEIKPTSNFGGKRFGVRFNGNHVGVEVGERIGAFSSLDWLFDLGEKFHAWVDYQGVSKCVEIRVAKFGKPRPDKPALVDKIDLLEMWDGEEVFARLSSSGEGDSEQDVVVYFWSFGVRDVPKWLHSKPVNPESLVREGVEGGMEKKKKKWKGVCELGVVTLGCGALAAMVLLSLWAIFVDRSSWIADEDDMPPKDFRYEVIDVLVEDGFEDPKK